MRIASKLAAVALLAVVFVPVSRAAASAVSGVCPAIGSASDCNMLITLTNSGVSITYPWGTPYDGIEDNLVGFINNTTDTNISKLGLTGSFIFGFDADGHCTYSFAGNSYCAANGASSGVDPYDYQGPNNTFTIYDANTGDVNFTTPIAPGGSAYWSLEESASAVNVSSIKINESAAAPEPASLTLLATGLFGLGGFVRRRRKSA